MTLLFTDIAGSTASWERHPQEMAQGLRRHDEILRQAIEAHGGAVFKTVGDAFCAAFATATGAVDAAGAAQLALAGEKWPEPLSVEVRMALHTGSCEERDGDYFGPAVNRTARLEAVAHGGQTVISAATAALLQDAAASGFVLRDLGEHRLRDLGRPEHIFQVDFPGLAREFPPLRSLDNPSLPNNLPALLASFVGRGRELAELRKLVDSQRLVTLTGAGGSGKTRLALQVAAEVLDGSGDGVWLVELAPVTDEQAVSAAVAAALGIPPRPGASPFDSLLSVLSGLRALVVLDNCEHLVSACAKLAEAVLRACPGLHVLATSREPLGIAGETVFRVPSLSLPGSEDADSSLVGLTERSDAVALFVERARSQGVELASDVATGELAASLCRRLDGMPLAIELATARLRSMSLANLVERLDQRFRLLTGGSRNALPRQQTLRATVEWSYSLLTPAEQSLLRRASVFSDGFDLEAVETVGSLGDIELFDVADLLASLVDKSLVLAERNGASLRYHMLETIRQFAAERLVDHDEVEAAAVHAAHCVHYLDLAERAREQLRGREQGHWVAVFDAEQGNVHRAMKTAAGLPGGDESVLRFAVALGRYWWMRKTGREIRNFVLPLLERGDLSVDPALIASASTQAALGLAHADRATSSRCAERAVEIARRLDDEQILTQALGVLGAACYFVGDHERSKSIATEAVERARRLGDDSLLAACLLSLHLGGFEADDERSEAARAEAIACAERAGDWYLLASMLNNAACQSLVLGDVATARRQLEESIEVATRSGFRDDAIPAINLGWVLRGEQEVERAKERFRHALRVGRRTGALASVTYGLLGMACCAGDVGDWRRAALLHGAAERLADEVGEPWQMPERRYREASIAAVREILGDEELARVCGEGAALGVDEVCELALADADRVARPQPAAGGAGSGGTS